MPSTPDDPTLNAFLDSLEDDLRDIENLALSAQDKITAFRPPVVPSIEPPPPPVPSLIISTDNMTLQPPPPATHSHSILTDNPGYFGPGYIGVWMQPNEAISFPLTVPQAGRYKVNFRYQNCGPSPATRLLNGTPISFPVTGTDWQANSWRVFDIELALNSGTTEVTLAIPSSSEAWTNPMDFNGVTAITFLGPIVMPPLPPTKPDPFVTQWEAMLKLHKPGPAISLVNAGINLQVVIDSLPDSGGIIELDPGVYVNPTLRWARPGQVLVRSKTPYGVKLKTTLSGARLGVYGCEALPNPGDIWEVGFALSGSQLAVWGCRAMGFGGSGIAGSGNFAEINGVSVCFNDVRENALLMPRAGSGISFFESANPASFVEIIPGYTDLIYGNTVSGNRNGPGTDGTDGNGIIVDDMHNYQSWSPRQGVKYRGRWLVAGNSCSLNGGVGIHSFASDNVHSFFNTTVENGRVTGGPEIDANSGQPGARVTNQIIAANWVSRSDGRYFDEYNADLTRFDNAVGDIVPGKVTDARSITLAKILAPLLPAIDGRYRPATGLWAVGALEPA